MPTRRLNVEKAIQAAGVVLRTEGRQASRLRLLKLLYIADRESIRRTGAPILGSTLVGMEHGPLHSEILDLIKGNHIGEPNWSRHFRNMGQQVVMDEEPDTGKLSRFDIEIIREIAEARANQSDYEIAVETHGFQEWLSVYPRGEKTSRPIPVELLIDAVGRGEDSTSILQDMTDASTYDRFFGGTGVR
jgi:hypothetical protein